VLTSHASVAGLLPDPLVERAALAVLAGQKPAEIRQRLTRALDEAGFDPERLKAYLQTIEQAVSQRDSLSLARLRTAGLAQPIERLVRRSGGRSFALVILHPTASLWTADLRASVVGKLRAAMREAEAPAELTGLFLVSAESARQVRQDFGQISLFTLIAVLAVLLLRFRHPGHVLLVLLPAGLGALWTGGLFAAIGAKLNLINLGVLPMIVALGVDDGIHLVAHYLESEAPDIDTIYKATGTAVILTSLTTMVTFGSLSLSDNLGLASVGLLALAGMGSCLIASLVVLPAVLALRNKRGCGTISAQPTTTEGTP